MERILRTTRSIDELSSSDLSRLMVPNNRVYLACRHNKLYRGEKIYEFAIMSKEKTGLIFCTEEDLFSKLVYPADKVEFLEEAPVTSFINSNAFPTILDSDKIFLAAFPTLHAKNLKAMASKDFKFSDLVTLNQRSIKDQKRYIDGKEKEFEANQKHIFTKENVILDDLQEFLP